VNKEILKSYLDKTFKGFEDSEIPSQLKFSRGKVRDIFDQGDELIISTSDRISAFDIVLHTIPCKGEVLNRIALYWFKQTEDIVPNHIVGSLNGRTIRVKKCSVVPVEVVVRGYLTGSAWRDYEGGNPVSGIPLPAGMKFNQKFDKPLFTPSTKAEGGEHDEPISGDEVIKRGLVDADIWRNIEDTAFKLFARGTELAAKQGLILVDTKYEFGILDNKLVLVDEVHTPDSSRYWYTDTYEELFRSGEKQKKLDKEYLRQWLMEQGFMGNGPVPDIPDEIRIEVASRYIRAFETVTGEAFVPESTDPESEKRELLDKLL
jgi:phosphoribosylaminoimidazole-succinocarboxamide synthase